MSSLFGGGQAPESFLMTGGGTGAPWNFGVSPYDQSQIGAATESNTQAMAGRYGQLGLGGSTMAQQDATGIANAGTAMTGQLQTQNEAIPALNPALQPQLNNLIGQLGGTQSNQLSQLASLAGLGSAGISGLGGLLGGLSGAGAGAGAGAGLSDLLLSGAGGDIAGGISAADIALALPFLGL